MSDNQRLMTNGDSLDRQVANTLKGSWLSMFFTELFQGISQIALLLLLLEAIWDWAHIFSKPDIYLLCFMTLGQSAMLSYRRFHGRANPWWLRLSALALYVALESLIEGSGFFLQAKHLSFIVISLAFVAGLALETQKEQPFIAFAGLLLARTMQGAAPLLFYLALDVRGQAWWPGLTNFFDSAPHMFLLAFSVTQIGALIALTLLAQRQRGVIGNLLEQLKTLSRWGFGSQVVQEVLRDNAPRAASRVERAIGFIDVRGFTAWSEIHSPEQVIDMLKSFYDAAIHATGAHLIKAKMSGDEVLLVLPADTQAMGRMQNALFAAQQSVAPLGLSAGAGLWLGAVVEGFFGAQQAQVHDVIGDTVNTAKRLCDHAPGGQLLAGPLERLNLLPERSQFSTISVQAKGKQRPILAVCLAPNATEPDTI